MADTGWRFLDTGFRSGAFNMQFDELLACRMQGGDDVHTLRVFRWKPWAISLGYNQNSDDIDVGRCQRDGIDIVRRPTGGRAILHAEELTYSVVMLTSRRSVLQVYNDISRALVRGLQLFGVDVALQRSQPDFREHYRQATSIPCFASSGRYEIEWGGRKLVGSAQRRFSDGDRSVVLQHGSILCGQAHRRLSDYLTVHDERALENLRRILAGKTVDLSEILGRPPDVELLAGCIRKGFESEWGITMVDESRNTLQPESHYA